MVRAAVFPLLASSSPTAVVGGIGSVVVNPVEGETPWTTAHVGKERVKGLPAAAHLDASAAIVFELGVGTVLASSLHRTPYVVFRSVRHAVTREARYSLFRAKASTATGSPAAKVCKPHGKHLAAITRTRPHRFTARCRGLGNDREPSEALSRDVYFGGHSQIISHTATESKWATQVKGRATRLAELMRNG